MFKTRDFLPVIITALVVLILAIAGLAQSNACVGDWSCWLIDPFKILFGRYEPPSHAPLLLNLALQGGRVILLVGAFLSTVRVFISAARHDFRLARARKMKGHTIVCGLGETGMQVVRNMRSAGQKVVVIDRADDTVNAAACDHQGIPVVRGDATNSDALTLAGGLHARTIVVCTGDDATNMDIALHIDDLVRNYRQLGPSALLVLTEMRDQWLFSRLIDHDRQSLGSSDVDLRLFNTYENAARLLLRALRLPPGPEIDAGTFVIAGFGGLGKEVLLHMIRASPAPIGTKTKIIVLDRLAEQQRVQFLQSYPAVAELADVSFAETNISPDNQQIWSTIEDIVRDLPLLGAAICFNDDRTGLYAALNMRRLLDDLSRIHVPIFLRLEHHRHLGEFAAAMEKMSGPHDRLKVFGGLEELLNSDILIRGELDTLAKAIHAQYRDSRQSIGRTYPDTPWNLLPETLKMSNRRRADNMPILLAQVGLRMAPSKDPAHFEFNPEEVELLARLEHRRWVIDRRLLGVSYGEARSEFPPRHELLVDWEHLPEIERERNRVDFRNLPKVLSEANFEIQRDQKILAIEATLETALSVLRSAASATEGKGCVIIADVDTQVGREAAEIALKLPKSALWLVSSNHPGQIHDLPKLKAIYEGASGWVTREQFRGGQSVESLQ